MNKARSQHEKALNDLIHNPHKIGLQKKDLTMIMKEPMLLDNLRIIAEPDIIFLDRYLNTYLVEYKATNRNTIVEQLDRAYVALQRMQISGNFHKIAVYGGFRKYKYHHVK